MSAVVSTSVASGQPALPAACTGENKAQATRSKLTPASTDISQPNAVWRKALMLGADEPA